MIYLNKKAPEFIAQGLFTYASSFLMPKMALSSPEMNLGLLMTTIFNMYSLL
nr:hypothetical protein [Ruminococcus flavefaciens]